MRYNSHAGDRSPGADALSLLGSADELLPFLLLVVCQQGIDGYNRFNLIRASSVVNRQSTGEEF
ncbi:hypothetical protein H6F79_08040 [Trichocoleus sp. FACHB-69]|nr:hypothetical protein [Trichocoleus sp. FACHB-69]